MPCSILQRHGELAERLKAHDWKSCIRQKIVSRVQISNSPPADFRRGPDHVSAVSYTSRRGGRVVECGGLENRFTRNPGNEGSNPSSSARTITIEGPAAMRGLPVCAGRRLYLPCMHPHYLHDSMRPRANRAVRARNAHGWTRFVTISKWSLISRFCVDSAYGTRLCPSV